MGRIDKYISEARERAKRRKSPWDLLLIPLVVVCVGGVWFLSGFGLVSFQRSLFPNHAILASCTRLGSIIMFVAPGSPRLRFVEAYDRIKSHLKAQGQIEYTSQITNRDITRLRKRYSPAHAERILAVLTEKQ